MDKKIILSKLNKALPQVQIETQRFGRTDIPCIWVESQSLFKVAEVLKTDLHFDFLENLNLSELDEVLILTYFLSSSRMSEGDSFPRAIILRLSVEMPNSEERVTVPSLSEIWPSLEVFEDEAFELFGVSFENKKSAKDSRKIQDQQQVNQLLPQNWKGFPLRKSYTFPQVQFESLGATQSRRGHS